MSEKDTIIMEQMLDPSHCGLLKIALDDELTIIYASDAFYKLIEMDQSKQTKPPKSIFKTVYSADIIFYTQQIAAQKRKQGNQFLLFYRILQKTGGLKWILISGNKTDEEFQKQNKAFPIYLCMTLDISEHMTDYKKLEQELDYHRTILELSKELFFQYDIASDTLAFKELFRKVFGKESEFKEFSKRIEKTKLIHPDDLPGVIKIYKSMMSGKKQARLELRMTTKDGDIAAYVCYASIIFDDNKNPSKVVGKLSLINTKQDEQNVTPKLQLDSLTKVYNKESAEKLIVESMTNQEEVTISAIFMCEVHNYKGWNEVVKLVEGENVLTTIAGVLKKHFRSTDVIGRVGLGEFVVFMKDMNSEINAYKKAENICKEVDKIFNYEFNRNSLSISIGVAITKGKANYQVEAANANAALIMARKDNNSSFEIFYPSHSK